AQQVEQANKAKAEQSQLAGARQAQVDELAVDRDRQSKTLEECQQQVARLSDEIKAAESLAVESAKQLELAHKARNQQGELCTEQLSRLHQAQQENKELQERQRLMNDELTKAEAQIDLITDLLLREQGI
ncbi:hypothetical protein, partial [Accumulibacter sp.]